MSLDWVITGLSIIGKLLGVKKMRSMWLVSGVNQFLWIYLCIEKEMHGLILLSVIHLAMALWGWRAWGQDV